MKPVFLLSQPCATVSKDCAVMYTSWPAGHYIGYIAGGITYQLYIYWKKPFQFLYISASWDPGDCMAMWVQSITEHCVEQSFASHGN